MAEAMRTILTVLLPHRRMRQLYDVRLVPALGKRIYSFSNVPESVRRKKLGVEERIQRCRVR